MATFLITGGGGYVGFHIGLKLVQLKMKVILLDINFPSAKWGCSIVQPSTQGNGTSTAQIVCPYGSIEFVQGDVRNASLLLEITRGVDCVIHTASYGMSGREQMPPRWDAVEDVNINGTRNVIEACARNQCRGLVYTSTNNVIFGDKCILGGDESLPYFPLHRHVDHYSRTKSIAEQLVLTSNGKRGLQTCALRLAGVIGPGEPRHCPRIAEHIRKGWVHFDCSDQHGALADFIGIENVVQGHVKGALKLIEANPSSIGGEAFFLSDGQPVNSYEYFRPLFEYLGQPFPRIRLPAWIFYVFVYFIHLLHTVVHRWFDFAPYLTIKELYKISVTHYFSIEKARRAFDYNPTRPNDLSKVIQHLHKTSKETKTQKK